MTGLELLKAPEATAGEIADIISAPCPPIIPAHCDGVSCRECWLTWLTGEPIKEKEPPDKRTAPDEEGLHPNLVAFLRQRKHLLGVLEDVKDDVIEEINSTQNKDARIQSLQPFVKNGYIKFSKKHKTLLKQMTEYPMGKNDDAPDGLQMAVKLALDVKIGRRVDYRSVIARALDFRRGAY